MSNRLTFIDALRGWAAFLVLICHCSQIDPGLDLPAKAHMLFEAGKYGVQLFFVISSLTILYSLEQGDPNPKYFLLRRLFRIAPLYLFAVLSYSLIYGFDPVGALINAFFLHGFSPRYINSIVPGGWSVGVEMVFYCTIPLLYKRITSLRSAIHFLNLSIVFSFLCLYMSKKVMQPDSQLASFLYFWLPNQIPVFALGFVVYFLVFKSTVIDVRTLWRPLAMFLALIIVSMVTKLSFFQEHFVMGAAFAGMVFLAHLKAFPGLINRFSLYLGKISYSLYLSQYAAMAYMQYMGFFSPIRNAGVVNALINWAINLSIFSVTAALIATCTYHMIESPFQKIGRVWIKKLKLRQGVRLEKHTAMPAVSTFNQQ